MYIYLVCSHSEVCVVENMSISGLLQQQQINDHDNRFAFDVAIRHFATVFLEIGANI